MPSCLLGIDDRAAVARAPPAAGNPQAASDSRQLYTPTAPRACVTARPDWQVTATPAGLVSTSSLAALSCKALQGRLPPACSTGSRPHLIHVRLDLGDLEHFLRFGRRKVADANAPDQSLLHQPLHGLPRLLQGWIDSRPWLARVWPACRRLLWASMIPLWCMGTGTL